MKSLFSPFVELINGEAYRPHPEDAALPMGKRFAGSVIVVVGGGSTPNGWTQRVAFDRLGVPKLEGGVRGPYRRGSDEWLDHLAEEARSTSGWAIGVVEKFQAALALGSVSSQGGRGVERMLRVREDMATFGGPNISEDAVRVSVDHPRIDIGVTAGVKTSEIEVLEKELQSCNLKIAAVRVTCFAFLEAYLAKLHRTHREPDRTIVCYDGYSALIVGVSGGVFEQSEGGVSYIVSRPSKVREEIARKLLDTRALRDWGSKVLVIGSPLGLAELANGQLEVEEQSMEASLALIDPEVHHDMRLNLQQVREPLPLWVRPAFLGVLTLMVVCLCATAFYMSHVYKLQTRIGGSEAEKSLYEQAANTAKLKTQELRRERDRAIKMGEWVSLNYHCQALMQGFLQALPMEVALDAVQLKTHEGQAQLKLQFTLIGNEEPQRAAIRLIEMKLAAMGYDINKRDDPKASTKRRGAVEHSWDLIIPTFGS